MNRVRGRNIIWLCLATLLLTPMFVNFAHAQTTPKLYVNSFDPVNPGLLQTNPDEYFMVAISIMDADHVAGWQVKLTWDLNLIDFPPEVYEGSFFADAGLPSTMQVKTNLLFKYVLIAGYATAPGDASGNGDLAYLLFHFKATQSGSCDLVIYETKLWDQNVNYIDHTSENCHVFTTKPCARFTITPPNPIPGQLVTFDGSSSFDPNSPLPLVDYAWDFGDGSPIEHGVVVTHAFATYSYAGYPVTLTVTDSDGESWYNTQMLKIWRDLGIVSVWPTMTESDTTDFDAYATTLDYYEDPGYGLLSVIVTVVNFGTVKEFYTLSVIVDGYDYNGVYHSWDISYSGIDAGWMGPYPRPINPGTGSGFGNWFFFDISYDASTSLGLFGYQNNDPIPPGQYTITASITGYAYDQDPATLSTASVPFGVHGSGEVTQVLKPEDSKNPWAAKHKYKAAHGPMIFGGYVENFDNTIGVFRDPFAMQGEWIRIAFDLYDTTGNLVDEVVTDAVYLDYLESSGLLQVTWDSVPGKYTMVAYAQFSTDGVNFPYFGYVQETLSFVIVP